MKSLVLMFTLLVASLVAFAQTSTPYSASSFSATFNGPVSTSPVHNATNAGILYTSSDSRDVTYEVESRVVDHDINATTESTDWYLARYVEANADGKLVNTSNGTYQGFPYTYGCFTYTSKNGTEMTARTRIIIKNSREVFFITLWAPLNLDQSALRNEWSTFEDTLVIK
jgi:hypothetical protein